MIFTLAKNLAATAAIFLVSLAAQHCLTSPCCYGQDLPHSFARPTEAAIRHLHLDIKVDFAAKRIAGTATLDLNRSESSKQLILDTKRLDIQRVTSAEDRQPLQWQLGEENALLGQSLTIKLPDEVEKVVIRYSTSPAAEALQWLSPEQTTDKEQPFLFTQSQAILARTWVPCQDTPAVRMTYSARVEVPDNLLAVMSASNPQEKSEDGIYEFEMQQPIPSYLLALAVGDLSFESIGPRSGVYAEPSVIKKAAWEIADTERMIAAAESLYGPYQWERYDVIFLPSSFPFGGMENPRLTFATPTILAGDRSLVALIAHELAHSWSGNLVTNATWNDFWLNEGFTVYFEQRIMESVYGRPYSEMLAKLSLDGLKAEIAEMDPRDTWLKLNLKSRNPDDGMSAIAYDKGYFFLRSLEESVGREKWDKFLRNYFTQFAFKSMTTEEFVQHLKETLEPDVNVASWVYAPGLPETAPEVRTEELAKAKVAAKDFMAGKSPESLRSEFDIEDWTTHHWNYFLRSMKGLTESQVGALDAEFKLTQSGNAEITHDWLHLVIAADYQPAMPRLEEFLTSQGRRKFLQPLYARLAQTDEGLERAKTIYLKARPTYHAVSRDTIDKILGVK